MEIQKVLRILAIFITVAAFAVFVASQLMFPETSLMMNLPILIALVLSVGNIWSDALCTKKITPNK